MMFIFHPRQLRVGLVFALACLTLLLSATTSAAAPSSSQKRVLIPEEDRFLPFVVTIHVGDTVMWVNQDADDHTVVTVNVFTTAGHLGVDHLLPGTDSTGGKPSVFSLTFNQPGVFTYYCRFHATLDADHQPIAPGPDGGIQDANGNFGTPMSGIVNVLS